MENRIKKEVSEFENRMFYLIGMTCTWDAFIIKKFSLYNYLILLLVIYKLFMKSHKIKIYFRSSSTRFVLLFIGSIIFSIVASLLILPTEWIMNSIKNLIKFLLVFGFIFLLYEKNQLLGIREKFFSGLFVGAIIHMIWGYLQFILYALFGFLLNTFVFGEIFSIQANQESRIVWDTYVGALGGSVIRMKGLGWETANFALIMIMGFILCGIKEKRQKYRIFFIGATLLSTSRSGWVALFAVFAYKCIFKLKKMKINIKVKHIYRFLSTLVILIVFMYCFGEHVYNYLVSMIYNLINSTDTSDIFSSQSLHISYYTNIPNIIGKLNFLNLLFGCGFYSVGYVISKYSPLFSLAINNIGWNPETDMVTLLLGNGIFGFFLYYYFAIKGLVNHKNDYLGTMIVAILAEGLTYLLVRGTWTFLIIVFALLDVDKIKRNSLKGSVKYES